jgi:hypothetical protein
VIHEPDAKGQNTTVILKVDMSSCDWLILPHYTLSGCLRMRRWCKHRAKPVPSPYPLVFSTRPVCKLNLILSPRPSMGSDPSAYGNSAESKIGMIEKDAPEM